MLFLFLNHRRASADEKTRETSNTVFEGVYEDVCLSVRISVHTHFDPHVCLYLLQKQKLQIKQRRLTERRTEQRYNHYYATKKENLW